MKTHGILLCSVLFGLLCLTSLTISCGKRSIRGLDDIDGLSSDEFRDPTVIVEIAEYGIPAIHLLVRQMIRAKGDITWAPNKGEGQSQPTARFLIQAGILRILEREAVASNEDVTFVMYPEIDNSLRLYMWYQEQRNLLVEGRYTLPPFMVPGNREAIPKLVVQVQKEMSRTEHMNRLFAKGGWRTIEEYLGDGGSVEGLWTQALDFSNR